MTKTPVLLIGNGARENALADALIAGGAELYAYMQLLNPGIKKIAKLFCIGKLDDTLAAVKFATENKVEFAVIGPEAPLAAGFVDELEREGIKCVGPTKRLAQLETSKSFTRQLMLKYGIEGLPKFKIFNNNNNSSELASYLKELGSYVVKPDGLTGGKGVKLSGEHLKNDEEAVSYCEEILKTHSAVVIEEKLEGEEFSLQTLTDGHGGFLHFPAVQDHKRAFEGDVGTNTGGMGSYSDANFLLPFLTATDIEQAKAITEKVATAIERELGTAYRGVMYGGFMKTANGVKLLEYNARFGDPEAMNVLPLLKTNFVEICKAVIEGRLREISAEFEREATVCKYVVPEGYPNNPKPGEITVPSYEKDGIEALVFYAAIDEREGHIYTTKSRSVAFAGIANTIEEAERIAEEAASKVQGNVFYRKDIGTHQLIQKKVEHMKQLLKEKNELTLAAAAAPKLKLLYTPKDEPMRVAGFMSGTGSNLRKILELQRLQKTRGKELFKVVMIFTDTADEKVCNARKIAQEYKVPYYCNDMREYYKKRGLSYRKDMKIREEYDAETAKLLKLHKVDVAALCGYMSIITKPVIGSFLTINVHPADLRIQDSSGKRRYAGCVGARCVKAAIANREREVRSTTHIVTEDVDQGQILLVSRPVPLDDVNYGNEEELEEISHLYQEKLKREEGDWKILPSTVRMLAEGRFAADEKGIIYVDGKPIPNGWEMN